MSQPAAITPAVSEAAPSVETRNDQARPVQARLTSIDAYRGFVMLLMMAEVLRFKAVSRALPDSRFWDFLAHHQSHSGWVGCTLHDIIQPSFTFLVGVALPYSIASRRSRGQTFARMTLHAWWRALLLVVIGVFLRSLDAPRTVWAFHDTLSQIGMGYGFLFLLGFRPARDQWIALALILAGYFAAFALYPLPPADFDYQKVGVSAAWLKEDGLSGFAAHWQKNSNLAWAFDRWWINLFPRDKEFMGEGGGYATLSFIPTLGTMILGLLAGGVLRSDRTPRAKMRWLVSVGLISLTVGWLLGALGICPVVKRLWTPTWVLFSGGWCFLLLAAFYGVVDLCGWKRWTFPLVVIGMNSIAAYCIAHLFQAFVARSLQTHLGYSFFRLAGAPYEPFLLGGAVLLVYWLILYWMYRRKVFLRI
jgi:heparan-alpha-glucosaminide N-acetyltransferase